MDFEVVKTHCGSLVRFGSPLDCVQLVRCTYGSDDQTRLRALLLEVMERDLWVGLSRVDPLRYPQIYGPGRLLSSVWCDRARVSVPFREAVEIARVNKLDEVGVMATKALTDTYDLAKYYVALPEEEVRPHPFVGVVPLRIVIKLASNG